MAPPPQRTKPCPSTEYQPKGVEHYLPPKFTRKSVEKDHLLGATDGGMADKDDPKYDMFGGVELSGSFKYSAEDFLTMDFATEALQL